MTLEDIEANKKANNLMCVTDALNKSSWGMSVAQIAQSARLSVKTVHSIISEYSGHFDVSDGVYTLRGKPTASVVENKAKPKEKAKPPTQSVSIPGIDARPVPHVAAKEQPQTESEPLVSILGISLHPKTMSESLDQGMTAPDTIDRDREILDEMLRHIQAQPSGVLSRDLMMILNLRRDQVYKYAEILLTQNKIHKAERSNRQIKYKYGPAPEPVIQEGDFLNKVETVHIQKRSVTLSQDEIEQVLLKVFNMDQITAIKTTEGLVMQLTAEVQF